MINCRMVLAWCWRANDEPPPPPPSHFLLCLATTCRAPALVRSAAIIACVTVLCYVASEYMALYTKKTSWYSLEQLLPPLVSQNRWWGGVLTIGHDGVVGL